jgi:hypothetical protein
MRKRAFFLPPEAIRALAGGRGLCFATDRITVDGYPVGYMYREKPDWLTDSGWRFLAGDEPPGYVDNPDNLALYDVNIIANYDRDILPFLDAPFGSAFERDPHARTLLPTARSKSRSDLPMGPQNNELQRRRSALGRRRGPRR